MATSAANSGYSCRRTFLGAAALGMILTGCTITQNVTPTSLAGDEVVCLIENPKVREGFVAEVQHALRDGGIRYQMLPASASPYDCPVAMTYTARWSWDLTIYMSYAHMQVFRNGRPEGSALYDATKGSGNMGKFIDAEPKIREMVAQLFPGPQYSRVDP